MKGDRTGVRMYAIYDSPKDYPGKFVVRGWEILEDIEQAQPDAEPHLFDDMRGAHTMIWNLLGAAARLISTADPDPSLVEVWM